MENKKKIPELRFDGFTEDWEEKKFEKVFRGIRNNSLSRDKLNYKYGQAKNIHYGDILVKFGEIVDAQKQQLPFITSNEDSESLSGSQLMNGDIILADAAEDETVGKCIEIQNINTDVIHSGLHTIAVRPLQKFAPKYLGYYMNSNSYHDQLVRLMQGTKVLSISKSAIQDTDIRFPSNKEEQDKISEYITEIDELITNHQKKHNRLVTLKKSMLEKMFPKEGKTLPEIRFKGFEGDWDIMELGEVSPIRGGFAFKSKEFREKGVPIVKISNILPSGDVGGEFDFYEIQDQDDQYLLPHKSAVLAMSGATTGKVSILDNPSDTKVYQNQRVGYFQNLGKANYDFISTIVRSELFNRKINSVLVAGAQPNVSPKEINGFEFGFPKDSIEQERIGQYFKNIDSLLSSHQKQLEKLKNFKQSLSEKMFV